MDHEASNLYVLYRLGEVKARESLYLIESIKSVNGHKLGIKPSHI